MPTTRASVSAINADGWTVQDGTPIIYDPVGNPQYVVVQRPGFTTAGAATTITDNVIIMKRKRQAYPSQASLTTSTATLSDFIYSTDTVTGVTNNSTRAAPKPQAMWLTPDLERARSSTFTVKLAVSHAHARNGTPVAAVKFTATDGTNSVSVTVSAMTSRQWASGLYGAHYEATLNLSTLSAATICTVDATIYPWVGAAFQASVDGATYPSANFTVLKFLNDRTGSFGEAYAYVSTTGNDGTGVTSATATTALASPYLTITAAAAGIKAFNNTNYGRNLADGGTIRLFAGTHTLPNFSASTVTNFPLSIEGRTPALKSTTFLQDPSAHCFGYFPKKMKLKDLILKKAGGDVFFLDNGAANVSGGNMVTLENVKIDQNGTSDYTGWFGDVGRLYLVECDCATNFAAFRRFSGGDPKAINVIGCDIKSGEGGAGNVIYGAFASKLAGVGVVRGNSTMEDSDGTLTAYCFISSTAIDIVPDSAQVIGAKGWAMVMSVIEATASPEVQPVVELWDSGNAAVQNVVLQGNTFVGARTNLFYNDAAGVRPVRVGYVSLNVIESLNVKSDIFASDGLNVNNWTNIYKVGWLANCFLRGSYDDATAPGVGVWMGEIAGIGETNGSKTTPLTSGFVADASGKGTGAGNGDYTPGGTSAISTIPAGWAIYPVDMKGRTISNTGTAKVGAIQPAITLTGVGTITGSGAAAGLSGAKNSAAGAALFASMTAVKAANIGSAALSGSGAAKPAVSGSGAVSGNSATRNAITSNSTIAGLAAVQAVLSENATLAALFMAQPVIVGNAILSALVVTRSDLAGAGALDARPGSTGDTTGSTSLAALFVAQPAIVGNAILSALIGTRSDLTGAGALDARPSARADSTASAALAGQASAQSVIVENAILSALVGAKPVVTGSAALAGYSATLDVIIGNAVLVGQAAGGAVVIQITTQAILSALAAAGVAGAGSTILAGRSSVSGVSAGTTALNALGAGKPDLSGNAALSSRSAARSSLTGAGISTGLAASRSGVIGNSTSVGYATAIASAVGAAVLLGIAASGSVVGVITTQAILASLSAAGVTVVSNTSATGRSGARAAGNAQLASAGVSSGRATGSATGVLSGSLAVGAEVSSAGTLDGFSATMARAYTTTALTALGGAVGEIVGAAILKNGKINVDPAIRLPGVYRVQLIPGTYATTRIPGQWRAAQ